MESHSMPVFLCHSMPHEMCAESRKSGKYAGGYATTSSSSSPLHYPRSTALPCIARSVLSPRSRCWRKLCRETGGGGTGGGVRRLLRQPLRRLRLRLPWQQPPAEQAGHGGKVLFGGGRRRKKERTPSLPFPLPPPPPCLYHGGRERKELE